MTRLKCSDYGFECEFIINNDSDNVTNQFDHHADEVHGIEYHIETINQVISIKKA